MTISIKRFSYTFLLTFIFLCNVPGRAQWNERPSDYDDPEGEVFGISVPEEGVIWTLMEKSDWSIFQRIVGLSTDDGATWNYSEIDDRPTFVGLKVKGIDSDKAFASLITFPEEDSSRIYKTEDGGETWEFIPSAFNGSYEACIDFHFFNETEGVAFGAPILGPMTIYTTVDGGDNWSKVPAENMPDPLVNEGMLIFTGNGSYGAIDNALWFGTTKGRVYKTIDKGVNWTATIVDTTYTLHTVDFKDANNGVAISTRGALNMGSSRNNFFMTNDGGDTWTLANSFPDFVPSVSVVSYLPGSENTYVTTHGRAGSKGVMISYDGGNNWHVVSTQRVGASEFLSETYGWGGSTTNTPEQGLFQWDGSQLSLNATKDTEISVYPTVTTDYINISISNEASAIEEVQCYNVNGQMTSLSVENNQIDVNVLASGMYTLSIQLDTKMLKGRFIKK